MATTTTCEPCDIAARLFPAAIIWEDANAIAFIGRYPFTRGHSIVISKSHYADISSLPQHVALSIMVGATLVAKAILRTLEPDGVNLFQANGAAAGQTMFHFHLHVIPRYQRDGLSFGFPKDAKEMPLEERHALSRTLGGPISE